MPYNFAQLESIWIKGGGNPSAAPLAAAIALAESGGDTHNVGDGGQSHGLWQVYRPAHSQYDVNRLMSDPVYDAQAAVAISGNGTNWHPWSTFNSGKYRQFLQSGVRPADFQIPGTPFSIPTPDLGGIGGGLGGALDVGGSISRLGDAVGTLGKITRDLLSGQFWIDVAKIIFGALLMLIFSFLLLDEHAPAATGAVKSLGKDAAIGAIAA